MSGIARFFFAGAIVTLWFVGTENLSQHEGINTAIGLLCMALSAIAATVWIISEHE